MGFSELGKRAECREEAFFFDEPASLNQDPFAVLRLGPLGEWKLCKWNTSPVDADFFPWTANLDEAFCEGLGACEDQWGGLEDSAHLVIVARLVWARLDVHSVKGNHAWAVPLEDEGKQMDAGMTEVDVEKVGWSAFEDFQDLLQFAPVIDGGESADVFQPEAFEEVFSGTRYFLDGFKREMRGIGAFACQYKSLVPAQSGDLPVDVAHLGLEKCGAVAGDDGAFL